MILRRMTSQSRWNYRDKEAMAYELGDVLWYLANAANDLGYTLSEIGEMNLEKLADRSRRNRLARQWRLALMRLVFDIETNGLLDTLTTIHCLAIRDLDDETKVWDYKPDEIEQGLNHLLQADELIGHNVICYDIPAIQKIYPDFDPSGIKITDTLVLHV